MIEGMRWFGCVLILLQAPLPKNWEIYKDEEGNPFYFNCVTKMTQYRHPADDYFLRKIAEERQRHLLCRSLNLQPAVCVCWVFT
jgi:hypothetical protein